MYVGFDHDGLLFRGGLFCAQAVNEDTLELLNFLVLHSQSQETLLIKYDFANLSRLWPFRDFSDGYGDWRIRTAQHQLKASLGLLTQLESPDRIKRFPLTKSVVWFRWAPISRGMNCRCCGGHRTALAELTIPVYSWMVLRPTLAEGIAQWTVDTALRSIYTLDTHWSLLRVSPRRDHSILQQCKYLWYTKY